MNNQLNQSLKLCTIHKEDISCNFILRNNFITGIKSSEKYHFHSFFELLVVVTGNMHIMIEDHDFFLDSGDICIIPPNTIHIIYENEDSFRTGFRFSFSSSNTSGFPCFLSRFQRSFGSLNNAFIINDPSIYENYLATAIRILQNENPNYIVDELLFYAIDHIAHNILQESIIPDETSDSDSLRSEYIEDFINNNYYANPRIEALANSLNLSVRQTERVILRLFGISFSELVLKKRLTIAKFLLLKTTYSIEDIAFQTGFYDKSHFCHKFTAYFGISPAKYRTEHQNSLTF